MTNGGCQQFQIDTMVAFLPLTFIEGRFGTIMGPVAPGETNTLTHTNLTLLTDVINIGTVIANKRLSNGNRATIVDVGINLLFTSFWYEHEVYPAAPVSEHMEETTIYGPLCMNIDVIREAIQFPLLKKGDQFVIKRIGAYNMTQWMQFITLRPNVVLIGLDGKVHVIRKRENMELIRQQEVVPDHLK